MEKPAIIKNNQGYGEDSIKEELCVEWMAQLQHKQDSETHVVENAIVDKVN